jgi:hypothetical protein
MAVIKDRLRQMALTPRTQFKKLIIGTVCAFFCMLVLILSSAQENPVLFYALSFCLALSVAYAIPGYIGIWLWRMRKSLFNLDD